MENKTSFDKKPVSKIKRFVRWHDWAVDKLPILFLICFYLILRHPEAIISRLVDFFIFVIFSVSSTIYGYTINNYADLKIDQAQGKENLLSMLSPVKRMVILIFITAVSLASGSYFIQKPHFVLLWIIQIFTATFYSLPPIRFKERGLFGLLIPFFAQLVLPTMICFSIFADFSTLAFPLFLLYGFFKGGAYDIGHQFHDHQHDQLTDTKTYAVTRGGKVVKKIFKTFLIFERLSFLLLLIYLTMIVRLTLYTYTIYPVILILGLYLLVLIMVLKSEINDKRIADPYYVDIRGPANILHIIIPNILSPAFLSFLLCLNDPAYFPIFIFFIIWVFPTPEKILWPLKALLK
jgi:4-hydroxybenzoate polyprenyltransferase